jgi:glycosyltransferase involved in cell wall biosynthesis
MFQTFLIGVFALSALGSVYSYFIYPVTLLFLPSRKRTGEPVHRDFNISVIITAYNEEARIEDKLANTLEIDYPEDRMEIIVASDCCTDRTDAIVDSYKDRGVKRVRTEQRLGKENAQLHAVREAGGEILIFTDVATRIPPESIRHMVAYFADPAIGAVSSEDRFVSREGRVVGEGLYVKYEMWLRRQESRVNSLVGLSGSFFAARQAICRDWDIYAPSDFNTALNAVRNGMVAVTAPDVLGMYADVNDPSREYGRKYRTVLRGITGLFRSPEVLNPARYGVFAYQVFGHKFMRWLTPWFMIVLFPASLALAGGHWFFTLALAAQAGFYLIAALGHGFERLRAITPVRVVYFFVQANVAVLHAALGYLLYVVYLRLRARERPTGRNVIAVALGTQTPDLIDKPLAWYLHVLEYGRSLAHSVITGGLILLAVVVYLRHRGHRRLATAFAIGYLSHLVGDSYTFVLNGTYENLAFLVWPLLAIPNADTEVEGLFAHLARLDASVVYSDGVLLAGGAFALWLLQGAPGLWLLLGWLRRAAGASEVEEPAD